MNIIPEVSFSQQSRHIAEWENAQSLTREEVRQAYEKIYASGIRLADVEAIWFQRDQNYVELELRHGTRQVIEGVW